MCRATNDFYSYCAVCINHYFLKPYIGMPFNYNFFYDFNNYKPLVKIQQRITVTTSK